MKLKPWVLSVLCFGLMVTLGKAQGHNNGLSLSMGLPVATGNGKNMEGLNITGSLGYRVYIGDMALYVQPELGYLKSDLGRASDLIEYDREVLLTGSEMGYSFEFGNRFGVDIFSALYFSKINYQANTAIESDSESLNSLAYAFGLRTVYNLNSKIGLRFGFEYMGFEKRS